MKHKPTHQQQNFLDALIHGSGNLALRARAGCGKTSTIVMGAEAYLREHPRDEVLICAYNKAIADEVSEDIKELGFDWRQLQASTLHSLGFGLLKFLFKPTVDDKKVKKIVEELSKESNNFAFREYAAQIESLVHYAKQAGVGFFDHSPIADVSVWHRLADHFDVNGLDETTHSEYVVEAAQQVYRRSLEITQVIDFDDMILMPLVKNLRVKFTKDVVFLDEAQDLSATRQALARKFVDPRKGRLVIVGDDRQAIYGFSGADASALPRLIESSHAEVFPLSVTWRCPRSVVDLAQTVVPDIVAADNAPEGEVLSAIKLPDDLGPESAILCRKTAPLVSLAYRLIRSGTPCKIEGRSIGEGLKKLAGRWKVKTIDALINRLDTYQEREIQKAKAKDNDAKVEEIQDRVGTLLEICGACIEKQLTRVSDVHRFIDELFSDGADDVVVLATYHRSKGREWPRVILLDHDAHHPSRAARQQWQIEQEENLEYVAFTRAQETLVFYGPGEE